MALQQLHSFNHLRSFNNSHSSLTSPELELGRQGTETSLSSAVLAASTELRAHQHHNNQPASIATVPYHHHDHHELQQQQEWHQHRRQQLQQQQPRYYNYSKQGWL